MGNMLENTLRTWGTCWEPITNFMGTHVPTVNDTCLFFFFGVKFSLDGGRGPLCLHSFAVACFCFLLVSFCLARKATLGITIGLLLCLVSVILLLDWWVAWTFYSTNIEHHLLVVQFCSLVVSARFWFIKKSVNNQYKQITWHGFLVEIGEFKRLSSSLLGRCWGVMLWIIDLEICGITCSFLKDQQITNSWPVLFTDWIQFSLLYCLECFC